MKQIKPLDIAIVGSGICGMCTALAMAQQGHQITLFERDGPPPAGDADDAFFNWQRNGAAQFRHPHAFLGLMCNLIAERYPDLMDAFFAAGARRFGFAEMLSPEMEKAYQPLPGDEKLWVLLCRRATMETVIRRYVQSLPNITIRSNTKVTGLLSTSEGSTICATGLKFENTADKSSPAMEHLADLVIDASGRTTRFPGWFAEMGKPVPEEKDDAEIVYYTKHFRLNPGQSEPPRGKHGGAGDLGYLKFGVFPGDNGNFAVIICLPIAERELLKSVRDNDQFDRICMNIPGLAPWLSDGRSSSTTEPFGIADIQAVWRHFLDDDQQPLVQNFFAVGDAAIRTNPLYGRGCSIGILHAHLLNDVVNETNDPVARAQAFDARTKAELRPIFDASLSEDRRGIKRSLAIINGEELNRPDSIKKWFGLAFGDALGAASRQEIDVLRGALKSFHLLEKPGDFLKDSTIRRKVLRYMLKGRRRNAASRLQAGPDRDGMHQLLDLDAGLALSPAASVSAK